MNSTSALQAGREADAGRSQTIGRADPGELRARAVHRAVHGRGRRIAACRRHRQSGAADAIGEGGADARHQRRRAGLCLARRRHYLHGRRHAIAGRRLRLCSDAGAGGADRVHAEAVGLCGAGRPYGSCASAGLAEGQYRDPSDALAAVGAGTARHDADPADRVAGGRQAASSAGRSDRPDRGGAAAARRTCVRAYDAAARRFTGLLDELCGELPLLRQAGRSRRGACCRAWSRAACMPRWRRLPPITSSRRWRRSPAPSRRRFSARWSRARELERAYVNNGGDIALHLARMANILPWAWWTGRTRPACCGP